MSGGGNLGPTSVDLGVETLWDAKGDLAVGTGPDAATRLPIGVDGYSPVADSREATGVKWVPPPEPPTQGAIQGSFIRSGGGVAWTGSGFTYVVGAATYYINGVLYTSPQVTLVLDASEANDRIDVIVLGTDGAAAIVKGTAAVSPTEPNIDPATQCYDCFVYVTALASAPSASSELVYGENAGSPTEWAWTTSGSGFNVDSANNPKAGSKCIEGTAVANGAYAQGQRGADTIDPNAYDQLVFYVKSKAVWNQNRFLLVSLLSNGVRKGNVLRVASSGTWGFLSSDTTTYQAIIIPTLQFAVPSGTTVNQVRIQDSGGSIGFYIDDMSFLGDASGSGSGVTGITQEQADARYLQRGNNLSDLTVAATARTNAGILGQLVMTREGAVVAEPGTLRFYNHLGVAATIINVQADINTAPTGANLIADVHKSGTTIFTTQGNRPTVAATENNSGPEVPDVTAWADGEYLTLDVDQVGSTIAGSDITVTVKYRY